MRVFSAQATTPNGNEYKISRTGRIILTSGAALYGLYRAEKSVASDKFLKSVEESTASAVGKGVKYYGGARKAAFLTFSAAICAIGGFVAGAAADFVTNRISKNKADSAQKA